jgi:epimerase transport system membrane fusion protein
MAKIAQIKVQILEEKEQILLKENTFKSNIVDDLRKAEFSVSEYQSKLKALNNTLSRTVIRSPDNGVVTGLEIHTIGGVIAPGDPIMFIVPSLRSFMIEVKVPSQQSEKLALSSNVDIRFPSFNSFKGVIPGVVKTVSADSFVDEQTNISYYNVKIKVSPEGVERMTKEGIQLSSGMPTEVIIKTGARTLLDYLLTPFNNMAVRSFNEQ